jgi:GT2 family glycosyltransferase
MIVAAIPTVDVKNCIQLVKDLSEMENGFDRIFLLNNSSKKMNALEIFNGVVVINLGRNIGVNPAWNYSMDLAQDLNAHLAILNDDILVKKNFVTSAVKILESDEEALEKIGLVVPCTTHEMEKFKKYPFSDHGFNIHGISRREGWCMFLHMNLIPDIERIPEEMKTFCGDDWIFHQVQQNGWLVVKDNLNVIYHEVGRTLKKNPKIRETLIQEKGIFNKYLGR